MPRSSIQIGPATDDALPRKVVCMSAVERSWSERLLRQTRTLLFIDMPASVEPRKQAAGTRATPRSLPHRILREAVLFCCRRSGAECNRHLSPLSPLI